MKKHIYFTKHYFRTSWRLILFFILLFASELSFGQHTAKRNLTQDDYKMWHTLQLEAISDDGNWVSYRHYYTDTDTLFVHNRKNKKIFSFAKGSSGSFKKNHYVCGTPDGLLHIISLKTGNEKVVKNVLQFTAQGAFIVTEQQMDTEKSTVVLNYEGKELYTAQHVFAYEVSPDEAYLSILKREGLTNSFLLLDVKGFIVTEHIQQAMDEGLFSLMAWSSGSNAVVFYDTKEVVAKIRYFHIAHRKWYVFSDTSAGFPASMNFYVRAELNVSSDGNRVFFKIRQKPELNVVRRTNGVQVWNTKDAQIYPSSIVTERFTQNPRCAMWEPAKGLFLEITDDTYPVGGTGGNSNIALVYNPLMHSAADKFTHDADIYVSNLIDGKPKLMAMNVIGGSTNAFVSPTGKYVSYLEQGQWNVYNVATGVTSTVTAKIPVSFSIESLTEQDENSYGNPGWSVNDDYIILYDEYDIWKIKPDGSSEERLTRGREQGIKYRLVAQKSKGQTKTNDGRITTVGTFDLRSKLLLKSRSIANDYNGIVEWYPNNTLKTICYLPKAINGIAQSEESTYVWSEEEVSQSPTLMVRKGNSKVEKLHMSNKQQQLFNWTKAEVLDYQNSEGIPLKGILYYPADYTAGKLYPMVVHIYQKQSNYLHKYTLPTLVNSDGFNKTNLTSKGYFVFLPDITYTVGAIGASAVDCVEAAVRKALENPAIDAKNVGLIGHSFGGTQTDFIITQSRLFKCAIAGAATTDFISSHLSVTPNYKIPNFYKIERGQARMMVSPFEDWDRYLKNSALYHAAKVNTPLLSWTGLKDGQVDYTQSFAFYLALRRLNKEHTMLVYPDVQHDMSGSKEASDLTLKIENWLDYYLKNSVKPKWL